MNNPSKIAELQELEHWKTKFDIAATATDGFFSRRWVADHIFNLSEEEFIRNQREMFFDRRLDAELEGVATAVENAAAGGAVGADLGGDLDSELAGGTDDLLGGDDTPAAEEPAEEAPEEDTLLASPVNEMTKDVKVKADQQNAIVVVEQGV